MVDTLDDEQMHMYKTMTFSQLQTLISRQLAEIESGWVEEDTSFSRQPHQSRWEGSDCRFETNAMQIDKHEKLAGLRPAEDFADYLAAPPSPEVPCSTNGSTREPSPSDHISSSPSSPSSPAPKLQRGYPWRRYSRPSKLADEFDAQAPDWCSDCSGERVVDLQNDILEDIREVSGRSLLTENTINDKIDDPEQHIRRNGHSFGTTGNLGQGSTWCERRVPEGMIDPVTILLESGGDVCSSSEPRCFSSRSLLSSRRNRTSQSSCTKRESFGSCGHSVADAELRPRLARGRNWRGVHRPGKLGQSESAVSECQGPVPVEQLLARSPGTARAVELGCAEGLSTQYSCRSELWWKMSASSRQRRQGSFDSSILGSQQPDGDILCSFRDRERRWPSGRPMPATNLPPRRGEQAGKEEGFGLSLEPPAKVRLPAWMRSGSRADSESFLEPQELKGRSRSYRCN